MHEQFTNTFVQHFGTPPDLVVQSPGRVNLIGDHTDYNEGWAFPIAVNLGTLVAAHQRADQRLHSVALRMDQARDEAALTALQPHTASDWSRYVRGVAALLQEQQGTLPGADLLIGGDLPLGAGLSSSASLEMGVAVALLGLAGASLDDRALARLGQRVENEIIGLQSGIMDQITILRGVPDHALLIDCRTLDVTPVPLPTDVRVLVCDSAVPRTLAGSGYNQRRRECEAALDILRTLQPELRALRDVTPALLDAAADRLTATELRRARHVVSENQRVLDSVAALQRGEVATFGQLMVASHQSLRDDYEVSVAPIDTLVAIALDTAGVYGARLTGGGFGGCVVALATAAQAAAAAGSISDRYRAATGHHGNVYICRPSAGTHLLTTEHTR